MHVQCSVALYSAGSEVRSEKVILGKLSILRLLTSLCIYIAFLMSSVTVILSAGD